MTRTWPAILAAAGLTLAVAVPATSATAAWSAAPAVRVNQVGYPTTGPKVAYVMLARPARSVKFEVTTPYGVAFQGTSTDDVGSWNSAYRAVYRLSFSGLKTAGEYRLRVTSPAAAVSPAFVIGTGNQLYRQLVGNAVRYFTSERDGPDVASSVLDRRPANLTDENAYVYADPSYDSNDNLLGTLNRTAGSHPDLQSEASFGLQWITKLWNPALKVLYAQVGIGNGNAGNTIQGDYNFWFLPPARHLLGLARSVYAMAKITDVGQLVTAFPHDFYPATQWKSDMAWGSSFVVGAGTVFPHCMQSEIANLAGSLTGTGAIQLGATTDGPSGIGNFTGLGTVPGMRACSAGHFATFNTTTAGYEDNVVSWPSVEPADDYTAASLFAFALGGDQGSGLG